MNTRKNLEINFIANYFKENNNQLPLSFKAIKDKKPDRGYFIKSEIYQLRCYLNSITKDLYQSLTMTFSLENIDYHHFKRLFLPIIFSSATLLLGEFATSQMSRMYSGNDEDAFLFKFILSISILTYCIAHRVTEKHSTSIGNIASSVAMEILGITYFYGSTFRASRILLQDTFSESYALISSLGISAVALPGLLSYIAQKTQAALLTRTYARGAQRSDTAFVSCGLTPISNIYLQFNHFLISELILGSRLFQLGLISDNILHAQKILKRFRNLPALLADIGPTILKKLISEQEKIRHDFEYNNALQTVLRFTKNGPAFFSIPRYQLRTGDLVYCDERVNLSSVPISGEIFFLRQDHHDQYTQSIEQKSFSINLKTHNGEDKWIELKSNTSFDTDHAQIDLHLLGKGKQAGILSGDKLNLYGANNCFIQIKPEKKYNSFTHYEKKSIINQIINERKQKNILYAMLSSIAMASFLSLDIVSLTHTSLTLLFNLFQTMIPFSETFLREMINSKLLKKLNATLIDNPIELIDALRIVDLCNTLGGYYQDKFPNGVAIISDKTGTLTTTKMDVLGCWTKDMPSNTQSILNNSHTPILPDKNLQSVCFEVFASAYTNETKELEPEEHAILEFFMSLNNKKKCLTVNIAANQHLKKVLLFNFLNKEIETFHLGLYRNLGGRLTLVNDNGCHYLVFCGIPKYEKLYDTPLYYAYNKMEIRKGVLSRDWCIARGTISNQDFDFLKNLFIADKNDEIEEFLLAHKDILRNLLHFCTFIINNPVKPGAEKFITQCRSINVPVFVATGDTIKAAENIANVLNPNLNGSIITIKASEIDNINFENLLKDKLFSDSTIIFGGVNEKILFYFNLILQHKTRCRPIIIFSEMSTEDKGILSQFLDKHQFFVVANGDGSNDALMMRNAHMVITHLNDDVIAPSIDQFSNLTDRQIRQLFTSDQSFYELFDIHEDNSLFLQAFTPLANSQEKPTIALALKNSKMSFELAKSIGASDLNEMPNQHWYSVAFDLLWLCISYQMITTSDDLPADHQHLNKSNFINQCLFITTAFAFLQAFSIYFLTNESTNLSSMLLMLCLLPVVLKSIFSAYGETQNELQSQLRPQHSIINRPSFLNSIAAFFQSTKEPMDSLSTPIPTTKRRKDGFA